MSNTIQDIYDNDEFGLLEIKESAKSYKKGNSQLVDSFEEINQFYKENGREPIASSTDIAEYKLYCRLEGLRTDEKKIEELKPFDKYYLLPEVVNTKADEISSIEDIVINDEFGLLGEAIDLYDSKSIFKLDSIPAKIDRVEKTAHRQKEENFEEYKELFDQCHKDLREGKRQLVEFVGELSIKEGDFYVLKGILVLVVGVGKLKDKKYGQKETRYRKDSRLLCVFENGTRSEMLMSSLSRDLYRNGKRVTDLEGEALFTSYSDTSNQLSGWIYVLKSKSTNPIISEIKDLYKIGFSTTTVEERIKNAHKDPTYLMSEVEIIASFKLFGANPQKLEALIHRFFADARLKIDLYDKSGARLNPSEWFVASIETIDEAITLLSTGDIVNYRYDTLADTIVPIKK